MKKQPEHNYSRREFGKLALAGVPSALVLARAGLSAADSKINGVRIGAQSYSFRELSLDDALKAYQTIGIGEAELFSGHIEPRPPRREGPPPAPGAPRPAPDPAIRENLRKFRLETPLDHFVAIKKKFDAAGVKLQAYNLSFNESFTDEEIDRGFEIAKALGAEVITASTTLPVAQRVVPFAEKHQMVVAMHNHSNLKDPNEFATPESFAAAMKMSRYYKINLDIGHYTAANFDPIAFMKEHHAHITNLHLKDRKRDQGENTPWGEGDTPIREALQLLKTERWPIRAYVEYEYRGSGSPVEEVKKCVDYAKQALA
jgi:sugar phosphate isomerase/epimerase